MRKPKEWAFRRKGFGLLLLLVGLSLAGCGGTAWRQDCSSFVDAVAALAVKSSGNNSGGYTEQFKNKDVVWKLTFKEIKKNEKGEETLMFDEEPLGIRNKFFSGKPVMMSFKPASGLPRPGELQLRARN